MENDRKHGVEVLSGQLLVEAVELGNELVELVGEAKNKLFDFLDEGNLERAGSCRKAIEGATGCMVALLGEFKPLISAPQHPFELTPLDQLTVHGAEVEAAYEIDFDDEMSVSDEAQQGVIDAVQQVMDELETEEPLSLMTPEQMARHVFEIELRVTAKGTERGIVVTNLDDIDITYADANEDADDA